MNVDTVSQDMFAMLQESAAPMLTRWSYSCEDPYAVVLAIQTRGDRWVEWEMARDLLVAGLAGAVGIGDVRLRPELTEQWDVVHVEIRSGDGRAVLVVDRDLMQRFVDATMEMVPLGSETEMMDLDGEIADFARTWCI